MADSDRWYINEFPRIFQTSCTDLEAQINTAKSATQPNPNIVTELAQELAKLSKSLADVNDKLPSYDQRQYNTQIKALEAMIEQLRAALKPKTIFAFKRTVMSDVSQKKPPVPNPPKTADEPLPQNTPASSAHALVSSYSYRYISLSTLLTLVQPSSELTISNLDHCIVNLTSPTGQGGDVELSAVHARNLSYSILILPMINGSVLLHDLEHCIIVAGCHQFRMHNSNQIHVHLSISSNPIIEHCSAIGFAPYPGIPERQDLNMHSENKYLAVQDFSHIRSSPSPHWFALDSDSILRMWPLEDTLQDENHIKEVLSELLP